MPSSSTNGDVFAVGTVCDGTGKETDVKFWERRKRIYASLRSDQEENRESPEISRWGKTARRKQEILDASEASVGALCP